jgi:hypothetical protein
MSRPYSGRQASIPAIVVDMHTSRITRAVGAVSIITALAFAGSGVATAAAQPVKSPAGAVSTSRPGATPDQLVGKCDQVGSAHLPKTRFLLHAGLAFGAFHRYILKALQNGGFTAAAGSRTKTFVKAALAGAFVVREIIQMDKFANADKTLCKIVPNIDGVNTALSGLIAKLKGSTATATDLTSVSSTFDSLQSQAGSLGATIKDRASKIPGV